MVMIMEFYEKVKRWIKNRFGSDAKLIRKSGKRKLIFSIDDRILKVYEASYPEGYWNEVNALSLLKGFLAPRLLYYGEGEVSGDKFYFFLQEKVRGSYPTPSKSVAYKFGRALAYLHYLRDIVHGDVSYRNAMVNGKDVIFFDFEYAKISPDEEDKKRDIEDFIFELEEYPNWEELVKAFKRGYYEIAKKFQD
jgi:hypothetical protein